MLTQLREINPEIEIIRPDDTGFQRYGQLIGDSDWDEIIERTRRLIPADLDPAYIPGCPDLESPEVPGTLLSEVFGTEATQIGVCRGMNDRMNGMEWHDCPELITAVTPIVLILGHVEDMENGLWRSELAVLCFLDAGETVELFPGTLHFAPCRVDENPFLSIITLPKGVNEKLGKADVNDKMLWMKRKWLIVHSESPQSEAGAYTGIVGKNFRIRYISTDS